MKIHLVFFSLVFLLPSIISKEIMCYNDSSCTGTLLFNNTSFESGQCKKVDGKGMKGDEVNLGLIVKCNALTVTLTSFNNDSCTLDDLDKETFGFASSCSERIRISDSEAMYCRVSGCSISSFLTIISIACCCFLCFCFCIVHWFGQTVLLVTICLCLRYLHEEEEMRRKEDEKMRLMEEEEEIRQLKKQEEERLKRKAEKKMKTIQREQREQREKRRRKYEEKRRTWFQERKLRKLKEDQEEKLRREELQKQKQKEDEPEGDDSYFSLLTSLDKPGDIYFASVTPEDNLEDRYTSESRSDYIFFEEKEEALEAVETNGLKLRYASEELRNDEDVVLLAVKDDGFALVHASEELRNDREIVLEAVKTRGMALVYASNRLRNDKEIVVEAVKNDGKALRYTNEQLRNDPDFIRLFQFRDGGEVTLLGSRIRRNEEILKKVFAQNVSFSSQLTLPFFSEAVNEKEESMLMSNIAENFGEVLGPKVSVLSVFRPEYPTERRVLVPPISRTDDEIPCYCKSIGGGCFGNSYRLQIFKKNIRNYVGKGVKDMYAMLELFKYLKTQSSGEEEREIFTYFVLKIYHNPILSEEKRGELIDKDSLKIPYHKNVASIFYHRNSEFVKVVELPDYEDYWKKRLPGITGLETGILIMKYYKQDLGNYMKKRILREVERLSKLEFCRILGGIISGICHLHSNFIVHRDVHPGNIFVNEHYGRIWVGDFGCCLDLRTRGDEENPFLVHVDEEVLYSAIGSSGGSLTLNKGGYLKYLAPEIANFEEEQHIYLDYSKADLYSVGILSLFLIYSSDQASRVDEFLDDVEGGITKTEFVYATRSEKWVEEFSVSKCFSDEDLFKFVENHLVSDVSKRISFSESQSQIDEITGKFMKLEEKIPNRYEQQPQFHVNRWSENLISSDDEDEDFEEREAREKAFELEKLMEIMDRANKKFEVERNKALMKQKEIKQNGSIQN